ncbi:MAG TPA: putative metal-dependent hydrolase [Candidatus Acidoferrales bacterium]|nr:putative metal-dependent hydrolase [Candidatus Acidoferrales bacterium]
MSITVDVRYPIGRFQWAGSNTPTDRRRMIANLESIPDRFARAVEGLGPEQLNTPYREDGWTIKQVVHHVADSHMQMLGRVKMALTETNPTIKPYNEARWAELADSQETPVEVSLALLKALHTRFTILLRSLKEEDWAKKFNHPERGPMTLDMVLAMYNWHGEHHLAHINGAKQQHGW